MYNFTRFNININSFKMEFIKLVEIKIQNEFSLNYSDEILRLHISAFSMNGFRNLPFKENKLLRRS